MSELLRKLIATETECERRFIPPTPVASMLTKFALPVWHHNSESILGKNDYGMDK